MRDIVTKVNTPPKNLHGGAGVRTKTKYKNFEDYARLHRDSSEDNETCSTTSYMLKNKFKSLDHEFDRSIKDDQESVGSDDSGLGSISEAKEPTKYAAYNEFLSGYSKKPVETQPKKTVRSEIFIQVGDSDRKNTRKEFIVKPVAATQPIGVQRQFSSDSGAKFGLTKRQNFNSIPRKFEPTSYPKPEVAATIVRPVVPPNLSRSSSLRHDESDGGFEVVMKPKLPPVPVQLKTTIVRSPVRKTMSSTAQFLPPPAPKMQEVQSSVYIPNPPPLMPMQKPSPAPAKPTPPSAQESNPMQMVFDEIRKRNTNMRPLSVTEQNVEKTIEAPVLPQMPPPQLEQCNAGVPPPPPPMLCNANGSLKTVQYVPPPQNSAAKNVEKERQNVNKPAPAPLQQELFKKLSEMNKKNQSTEGCEVQPPTQKYNTLARFVETEKECTYQQRQPPMQTNTLDRQDPKKKIVYNVYREMLGSYNAKANGIVAALPSRMVREDQGVKKQLESL